MYGIPGNSFVTPPPGAGAQTASLVPQQDVVRVSEKALYSTYLYTAGQTLAGFQGRFFSTQKGQVGQGFGQALSIAETNMREGGRIQSNEAFDIAAISLLPYYFDTTPIVYEDIANVLFQSALLWDFSTTTLEIAPCHLIGAGGGVFGATADTGAAEGTGGNASGSRIALTNGSGFLWIYRMVPMTLSAGTTFTVVQAFGDQAPVVFGGPNTSDLAVKISLLGKYQTALATA